MLGSGDSATSPGTLALPRSIPNPARAARRPPPVTGWCRIPFRLPGTEGPGRSSEDFMDVRIETVDPIQVARIRYVRAYMEAGPCFGRIFRWAAVMGVRTRRALTVSQDNSDTVAPENLRFDACVEHRDRSSVDAVVSTLRFIWASGQLLSVPRSAKSKRRNRPRHSRWRRVARGGVGRSGEIYSRMADAETRWCATLPGDSK